jgi:hypothetical protein
MTELELDDELRMTGRPEDVIPIGVQRTVESMIDGVIVAALVIAVYRDSKGNFREAKSNGAEHPEAITLFAQNLRATADQIDAGSYSVAVHASKQNSPGGDS